MNVRRAVNSDLLAVEQISRDSGYHVVELAHGEGSFKEMFKGVVLIADAGGEPLGYAALSTRGSRMEIVSIEVRKGHQNQGIATFLLGESEKIALELGKNEIFLFCHPRNRDAMRFYSNGGYEKKGLAPGHYSTGEPSVLFSKMMGPAKKSLVLE